jgi:hypothetical protein
MTQAGPAKPAELDHRRCSTSRCLFLPATLPAQPVYLGGMMLAVPRVRGEGGIQTHSLAGVGVQEAASKLRLRHRVQQLGPSNVQRFQQSERRLDIAPARVFQGSPAALVVRLDCWQFLGQRPLEPNVTVHVTVRHTECACCIIAVAGAIGCQASRRLRWYFPKS